MDDSLSSFAEAIRSGGRSAQENLKALKSFLARNRHDILRSWGRNKRTRDSFHALIESLFSYARQEKASYVKATKPTQKTQATTRLSLCASGLRQAVQVAGYKFKAKMISAVINHITEALPTTGESYCEPLCDDYLRTLTVLLEIPQHVEHLGGEEWQDLVEFCLQGISSVEDESQRSHQNGYRDSPSHSEMNSSRSTPFRNIKDITIKPSKMRAKISTDDLMLSLEHLTAAPNSPILNLAERLFDELVEALERLTPTNKSSRSAFAALNSTLLRILTEKPMLSRKFALRIIPIIRRFWEKSSKVPLLRDEMLTTLTLLRGSLVSLIQSEDQTSFEGELQSLFDALYSEYSKLFERDRLQLDDISFSTFNVSSSLNVPGLHMRLASSKAEHNWTLLQTMSKITLLLETRATPKDALSDDEEYGPPRKRIRLSTKRDEFLRAACSEEPGRIGALQILCFLFASQAISVESLASALESLNEILLEESSLVVSWALLALSSCCGHGAAKDESLQSRWLQIWQLTSRSAANLGTSRFACHLMSVILDERVLQYKDCAETFDAIVAPSGLLSPPVLSDSALLLWSKIMIMRTSINPSVSANTLTRIVTWLRVTWAPEALQDRSLTNQMAAHTRPMDMLRLLLNLTGRSVEFPALLDGPASGPISRAHLRISRDQEVVDYLLLTDLAVTKTRPIQNLESFAGTEVSQVKDEFDQLVIDLLQSKVDGFADAWSSMIKADGSRGSVDAARIVSSLCMSVNAFLACVQPKQSKRVQTLQAKCEQLWGGVCRALSREPEKLAECLDTIGSCLPTKIDQNADNGFLLESIARMAPQLLNLLTQSKETDVAADFVDESDLMEIENSFASQNSQPIQDGPTTQLLRYQLPVPANVRSYRNIVTAKLHVLCSNFHRNLEDNSNVVSPTEYLLSLEVSDLIASGPVILESLLFQPSIDRAIANRVLEHIGTEIIGCYDFERCEAALCASIAVLDGLAELWVPDGGDDLCDSASQVYSWLINVVPEESIMSSRVHIELAKLLRRVLRIDPEYSPDESMPSPRTSLFRLLREGDLLVKFEIGKSFSDIFGQFVLKEHEIIFGDVLESLPTEAEWIEGLCLRLFVLAELASKWHTLLRRCVYHIFETAGEVKASSKHAMYCLSVVSESLGLRNTQELFKLFVSQLLYTWLETQNIRSIPYAIFGYPSLKALLFDVQDDITGQIIMRAKDDEAQELSECLEVPFEHLLTTSFPKVEAYSVAHDISTPRSQETQSGGGEARVRKHLGNKAFMQLIQLHFPSTLAVLFQAMDGDAKIDKAFAKRPEYIRAHETFSSIYNFSFSEATLPANQQPSFRAKYLLDELEFLCRRAGYDPQALWNSSLFVFIARKLLDSIHPALGSLHTCSVVRKLRVLVCLAGDTALSDYPLEMMLHALRPLITDFHSSDDALGLFQYLLDQGQSHLSVDPSFMASIALSTLTSLKVFLNSSQESTTQARQYKATLSKAQKFHAWFCEFLAQYESTKMAGGVEDAFRKMIQSAQMARTAGNAVRGTYESSLLQQLLHDKKAPKSLLNPPAWDSVLDLLSSDFEAPPKVHEDVLGEVEMAIAYSGAVWESVQRPRLGKGYLSWAGRVLGRAYASTGDFQGFRRREQAILPWDDRILTHGQLDSKSAILLTLSEVLFSSPGPEIGVVESTLQSIAARSGDEQFHRDYEDILPESLTKALTWTPYYCPDTVSETIEEPNALEAVSWDARMTVSEWTQSSAIAICQANAHDPVLGALNRVLARSPELTLKLFPYILHVALLLEFDSQRHCRQKISLAIQECLRETKETTVPHTTAVLNAILYLRNQPLPNESTMADRERWLDLNYIEAAAAAQRCHMSKTAILFVEIQASQSSRSLRRSSVAKFQEPTELLFSIFRSIDDPDSFYGVDRQVSLHSILEELEYEGTGLKSTSFQSATFDSRIRRGVDKHSEAWGLVNSLNSANLKGLARALLSDAEAKTNVSDNFENTFQASLALQQWDIPTPKSINSDSANLFRTFQALNTLESEPSIRDTVRDSLSSVMRNMITGLRTSGTLSSALGTLASLTEVDELLSSNTFSELEDEWNQIVPRSKWMDTANFDDVSRISSSREILFASLSRQPRLKSMVKATAANAQLQEIRVLQFSLKLSRKHSALQTSLNTATYLSDVVDRCAEFGICVDAVAQYEVAKVLWDQGEMGTSIKMLQQLERRGDLEKQSLPLSRPDLLATLGHEIAEARLEKPEEIIQNYLVPAFKELAGKTNRDEAGRVYHEFASFCDMQLQNLDDLEDYLRIEKLRNSKEQEVLGYDALIRSAQGREKDQLKRSRNTTKMWFDLDDREYRRLKNSRENFLRQSLENYLLCLGICDTYDNDVLRFCALWLDKSEDKVANQGVGKHIKQVASRKFVPLMTQLSSRLLNEPGEFQGLLQSLLYRICTEHPYHGMYQIFSVAKTKISNTDKTAVARHEAGKKLVDRIRVGKLAEIWVALHNTCITYLSFAQEKLDGREFKSGSKVPLSKTGAGAKLLLVAKQSKIPPATMKIGVRIDCDYSEVPHMVTYRPEFSIAGGVSAPKIATAVASDGVQYKQLFKGGNDDLRQDAIMEQVFEQVSNLLQDHRDTRQRNLGIRTYKVLPLYTNTGLIEFVENTIPLHDYLLPAHQKHFPRDLKPNDCRKQIANVQSSSIDMRVKAFRQVTEKFRPVLRYFFMEHFTSPDEWFEKRLAYTRSTAAISVLGHILGLGDRHGHNILLDRKTGEVVHIDLGVAFEQGRVLPVPEVVPFRLTRDLVDGMGITATEGVFRRCCEFTLKALRLESYSIMTILDVLRYDPLYSWAISPLRLKRIQEEAEEAPDAAVPGSVDSNKSKDLKAEGEADRALTVVRKKLGKSLSVTAMVNELIQQATDERNLAVLYCGWAAYA